MEKNGALKNATDFWDRAICLAVYPKVLAATSKIIMNPSSQPMRGIRGSERVE